MKIYKKSEFYFIIYISLIFGLFILVYSLSVTYTLPINQYITGALIVVIVSMLLLFIFLSEKGKSITTYKKLTKKFDYQIFENFNIKTFRFPEIDEFGNLGHYLNEFVDVIREFDELKREKLHFYRYEIDYLLNFIEIPVILIDSKKLIQIVNKSFYTKFDVDFEKNFKNQLITNLVYGFSIERIFDDVFSHNPDDFNGFDIETKIGDKAYLISLYIKTLRYEKHYEYAFCITKSDAISKKDEKPIKKIKK